MSMRTSWTAVCCLHLMAFASGAFVRQTPPQQSVKGLRQLYDIMEQKGRGQGLVVQWFDHRCNKCVDMSAAIDVMPLLYKNETLLPWFVKVNAGKNRDFMSPFDIKEFPTVRYFEISRNSSGLEEKQWEEYPRESPASAKGLKAWLDGDCGVEMAIRRGDMPFATPTPTATPSPSPGKSSKPNPTPTPSPAPEPVDRCAKTPTKTSETDFSTEKDGGKIMSEDTVDNIPFKTVSVQVGPMEEQKEPNLHFHLEGLASSLESTHA